MSEWRKRGCQKWLAHRNSVDESFAISDNNADLAATGIDPDKLLLTLTGAYAEMSRNWMITPGEDMLYKLAVYKKLTDGVIALQRAELQKVHLEIARERLALLREKRLSKSASSSGPSNETASSGGSPLNSQPNPAGQPESEPPQSAPSASNSRHADPPPTQPAQANPPPAPASEPSPQPAPPTRRRSVPLGTVLSINPLRIAQRSPDYPL